MIGNKFIMRTTVCALAAAAVMGTAGCGQKTVDYSVDDGTSKGDEANSGDSAGGLAGKLGIPESCDETFDVGDSGVSSIKCVTDSIEYPDAESMKTVYYETNKYDSETAGELAASLLDDAGGVFMRDEDIYIEDEIQRNIAFYENCREKAAKNGDNEDVSIYEEEIEKWQNKLSSAVDSLPDDISDTWYGIYKGTRDDHEYIFMLYNTKGSCELGTTFTFTYDDSEDKKLLAEVEGSTYSSYGMADIEIEEDTTDLENVCTVSESAALDTAMNFLSDMGISGVTAVLTKPLIHEWYKEEGGEVLKTEKDGYGFYFVRQIDGAGVADTVVSSADNLSINQETSFSIEPAADYIYVMVNDSGIASANGSIYADSSSLSEGDDAELLSWKDMLAAADESIAAYYAKYPTQYSKIEFNHLSLCYIASVGDDGKKCYIPAWEFKESTDTAQGVTDRSSVNQIAYIDARDGSYIDVVENAKKLNIYEDF